MMVNGHADEVTADALALLGAFEYHHPDPFRYVDREAVLDLVGAVGVLDGRDCATVGLMRLAAAFGPRNGHSGIFPFDEHRARLERLPLELFEFDEGVYVVDGDEGALGAEIIAIGGAPIAEVIAAVEPLVPHDNEWSMRARRPNYLVTADVLRGLGIVRDMTPIEVRMRLPSGSSRELVIGTQVGPMRRRPREAWRVDAVDNGRAVHVVYTDMRTDTSKLGHRVIDAASRSQVKAVVLDLRWNGGGDNRTYRPLLSALDEVAVSGRRLFVLTSRATFSAAMQLIVDLERRTPAVFVGEPTGGSPNQYGDPVPVDLPLTGLRARVATIAWTTAGERDERLTREPDIAVPATASAFFARRDVVLAAALAA